MPEIQGKSLRELRCKNDSCRKLIAYEKITEGIIVFICPRPWCQTISEFRFNYGKGREDIDKLIDMINVEGGEK